MMLQSAKMDTGHSWGPGEENKWYYDFGSMPEGKCDLCATRMVNDFENSGHPVFKGTSPLDRGILKKKKGKDTIHFNGEYSNVDPWYRTVHSANQLCIRGAVTKWCETQSGTESGKKGHLGYESARRTPRENEVKREELKSLLDIPMLPLAFETECARISKASNQCFRGVRLSFFERRQDSTIP